METRKCTKLKCKSMYDPRGQNTNIKNKNKNVNKKIRYLTYKTEV
jgi:hypothetical protein